MLLDANEETTTPPVPHFAAKLNVENLCGKQATQPQVLIVNPNGRINSHRHKNFISLALQYNTITYAGYYFYFHEQSKSVPWETYEGSSNI